MADGTITGVVPGIGISGGGYTDQVEISLDPTGSITFSGPSLARQNDPPAGARNIQIPNTRWVMNQLDAFEGGGGGQTLTAVAPLQITDSNIQIAAGTSIGQTLAWNGSFWAPQAAGGASLPLAGGVMTDLAAGGTGISLSGNRTFTGGEWPTGAAGDATLNIRVGPTDDQDASGQGIRIYNNAWIGIVVENYGEGHGWSRFNPNGIYIRNAIATGLNVHHHQGSGIFIHDHSGFGLHTFHYYNAEHGGVYVRNYGSSAAIAAWNYPESGGPHGPCYGAWNGGIGPSARGLAISMNATYGQTEAIAVWERSETVFVVGVDGAIALSPAGIASLKAQLGIP